MEISFDMKFSKPVNLNLGGKVILIFSGKNTAIMNI